MSVRDLFDLSGKVAIVTGGSRGLGLEMATALGEAGARIVINARRELWLQQAYDELSKKNIECLALELDISNTEHIRSLVAKTLEKWGQIDILVNNAGITWGSAPENMPLEKWEKVMAVNATGTFVCCQEVGREMIGRGKGTIINMASLTGLLGIDPRIMQAIGYQSSKAAIIIMTRQLAVEWAKHNIRVNAIAPYFFTTRMSQETVEKAGLEMVERIPMARLGEEGELKGVIVFLASDASSYITGQVINVDGGLSAW